MSKRKAERDLVAALDAKRLRDDFSHDEHFWDAHINAAVAHKPELAQRRAQISTRNALGVWLDSNSTLISTALQYREMPQHARRLVAVSHGLWYEFYGKDAFMLLGYVVNNLQAKQNGELVGGVRYDAFQTALNIFFKLNLEVLVLEKDVQASSGREPVYKPKQIVTPASPLYRHTYNNGEQTEDRVSYRRSLQDYQCFEAQPLLGLIMLTDSCVPLRGWYQEGVVEELAPVSLAQIENVARSATMLYVFGQPPRAQLERLAQQKNVRVLPLPTQAAAVSETCARAMLKAYAEHIDDAAPPYAKMFSLRRGSSTALAFSTAQQLGLEPGSGALPLTAALLNQQRACSVRLFKRWLLLPPPPSIAACTREACRELSRANYALPTPYWPRHLSRAPQQVMDLIQRGNGSTKDYAELRQLLRCVIAFGSDSRYATLRAHLTPTVCYESGLSNDDLAPERTLPLEFWRNLAEILDVVKVDWSQHELGALINAVPRDFYRQHMHEQLWSSIDPCVSAELEDAVGEICAAAAELKAAFEASEGQRRQLTCYYDNKDSIDAVLWKKPPVKKTSKTEAANAPAQEPYIAPEHRLSVHMGPKHSCTTEAMQRAEQAWREASARANQCARAQLDQIAELCARQLGEIKLAWHWLLVWQSLAAHAETALSKGWTLSETGPPKVVNAWPYWLERSEAVANTLALTGVTVITGSNEGGKSTILRTNAACAVKHNAGLFVSAEAAWFGEHEIGMRGVGGDRADAQKSAHRVECDELGDILALPSDALRLLDEIGRATETTAALALLKTLVEIGLREGHNLVLSTHHHELYDVLEPEVAAQVQWKYMRSTFTREGDVEHTHELLDGVSRCSNAGATMKNAGLPRDFIEHYERNRVALGGSMQDSAPAGSAATDAFDACVEIVREVVRSPEVQDMCADLPLDELRIGTREEPPPRLAQRHCVYVRTNEAHSECYIGESERIADRVSEHRLAQREPLAFHIFALPRNRTVARLVETLATRMAAKAGVALASVTDGQHKLRG